MRWGEGMRKGGGGGRGRGESGGIELTSSIPCHSAVHCARGRVAVYPSPLSPSSPQAYKALCEAEQQDAATRGSPFAPALKALAAKISEAGGAAKP